METSKPIIQTAVPRPKRSSHDTPPIHEASVLRRPRRMMPPRRPHRLLPTMEYRLVSLFEE